MTIIRKPAQCGRPSCGNPILDYDKTPGSARWFCPLCEWKRWDIAVNMAYAQTIRRKRISRKALAHNDNLRKLGEDKPGWQRDYMINFGKTYRQKYMKDLPYDYLLWMVDTLSESDNSWWREWGRIAKAEIEYRGLIDAEISKV